MQRLSCLIKFPYLCIQIINPTHNFPITKMKRIVFLDYVRVFACFLVMLVHAAENFYGAPGSTDMAGPMSFLANESDRLWVSVYDGFSRMSVPLFMIVSAFLLVPMKEGQSAWQFYRRHGALQHPSDALGADRQPHINPRPFENPAQLPDPGGAPVVHVSADKPLPVHTHDLAMACKSLGKRRALLHRTVSHINLYAMDEPLLRRAVGTMLLE